MALNFKENFITCNLSQKTSLSPSITVFRFDFPESMKDQEMGCAPGEYISVKKADVIRFYSPISGAHEKGHIDLCIKFYPPPPNADPTKPSLTQMLKTMNVGESLEFKGPAGGLKVPLSFFLSFINKTMLSTSFL